MDFLHCYLLSSCPCALQLYEEVYAECDKYADVEAVIVPPPPDNLPMHEPGRVFIKVANTEQAMKCKKVFDGRLFDNKKVQVGAPASRTWLAGAWSVTTAASRPKPQATLGARSSFRAVPQTVTGKLPAPAYRKDPWLLPASLTAVAPCWCCCPCMEHTPILRCAQI